MNYYYVQPKDWFKCIITPLLANVQEEVDNYRNTQRERVETKTA